jgi:hypothetical protein
MPLLHRRDFGLKRRLPCRFEQVTPAAVLARHYRQKKLANLSSTQYSSRIFTTTAISRVPSKQQALMTSMKRLLGLALTLSSAFAQHRGAIAGGYGRMPAPGFTRPPTGYFRGFRGFGGNNHGFARNRFGFGVAYGWPYYDVPPLYYGDEIADEYSHYSSANAIPVPFPEEFAVLPPARPAVSVMHEYRFGLQLASHQRDMANLTIVLKDGSTRSASASWVSGGMLHFVDLQSRQQSLAPQLIDREATERANEAKNLSMELPPG